MKVDVFFPVVYTQIGAFFLNYDQEMNILDLKNGVIFLELFAMVKSG